MDGESISVLKPGTRTLTMNTCCQREVHSDPNGIKLICYANLVSYNVRDVKTK